jgi:glycosyltransferase involved in cell wall biosynthesis
MFRDYFQQEFEIGGNTVEYLPQYASGLFDALPPRVKDGKVNLMFAGNIGAAQSIPTILNAAKLLRDYPQLQWHIVGDGSELENAKLLAQQLELTNVVFYGRKPLEQMPTYYAMADAMLLTLTADGFISMTLPGKAQTYMAAGKPIIAAANGEIPKVLQNAHCGYCAPAEDAEGLAAAVRQFLDCPEPEKLGENGRNYYLNHFTRDMFMDKLELELKQAARCEE